MFLNFLEKWNNQKKKVNWWKKILIVSVEYWDSLLLANDASFSFSWIRNLPIKRKYFTKNLWWKKNFSYSQNPLSWFSKKKNFFFSLSFSFYFSIKKKVEAKWNIFEMLQKILFMYIDKKKFFPQFSSDEILFHNVNSSFL